MDNKKIYTVKGMEKLIKTKIVEEEQGSEMKVNVNFRWTQSEVERAKKIAAKKGLKYQTYIKFVLKQQMDKDDKDFPGD